MQAEVETTTLDRGQLNAQLEALGARVSDMKYLAEGPGQQVASLTGGIDGLEARILATTADQISRLADEAERHRLQLANRLG